MEQILLYREKILLFISRHEKIVKNLCKLIGGFLIFHTINLLFGYSDFISQNLVTVLLALICVFLPFSMIYLLGNVVIIIQLASVSMEVVLIYVIAVGLYHLLYQRMFPEIRYLVIITPVFYYLHLPALLPLFVGTFIGIVGIPGIFMGSFIYFFGLSVQVGTLQIANGTASGQLSNYIAQGALGNSDFFIDLLAFVFVVILVTTIRKLQIPYVWYVSIGAGGVVYLILTLVGGFMTGARVAVVSEIIVVVISSLIVLILEFLDNVIDYSQEEKLEFEDDEYYYYVRAIPKSIVKEEDVNITKINNRPDTGFSFKKKRNREN
ncbi:MAG: hypothetical protein PHD56_12000 [Anaerostipes sp.]|nr:hypothetical protein [Anaerostipes sp.]MDD4371775.1 hypothetical protein [Anaerostipes sp.]